MTASFHLSLDVASLGESVEFYCRVLQAQVTYRAAGYVNLDIRGCQLTLKEKATVAHVRDGLHLGINLDITAFDALVATLDALPANVVVSPPHVVDAGSELERRKMYLRSPCGYLIEIKGYRNLPAAVAP